MQTKDRKPQTGGGTGEGGNPSQRGRPQSVPMVGLRKSSHRAAVRLAHPLPILPRLAQSTLDSRRTIVRKKDARQRAGRKEADQLGGQPDGRLVRGTQK